MIRWPSSPLSMPTAIDPSNKSCAPSVNDSCNTLDKPMDCALLVLLTRALLANTMAKIMAGDSISAIAAAI